ncbi:TIMELESS-interacting protein [Belonocnema kinseyi]|uniref:TIMELESS-interacting protein n=1 Tax=Belonocnema kinseyi TaxID=2817044 RepID=UPI00143DA3AB|nr:TIMELESS-interacting protein [Belonocnema kinseyi]XP_033218877.1 TIMELESS-interacting protein [Belonocnema kinseyi]
MSSRGERSDEEDVLELIGVNENLESNHGSGDELQPNDQVEGFQAQNSEDNDPGNAGTAGQKVTPKGPKRTKSNVPRLTTERLRGPKGVHTIEKYFEGFKFHGKGHEKEDLDRIMKRLEHWTHRLFPKLNFDDCLEKIENLGQKKELQVFLKKYRTDMITADEDLVRPELIDDDDDDRPEDSAPQEEFDLLLAEQINKQRQKDTVADSSAFDELLASTNSQNQNQSQNRTPRKETSSGLSDEIKERIERNRKLAMERKLATMKKLQELKMQKTGDDQNASKNDESENNSAQRPSDGGLIPDSENNLERIDDAEPIVPHVDENKNLSQSDSTEKVNDSKSDLISSEQNSERMEEDVPDSSENQEPGSENKNLESVEPMEDVSSLMSG